MMTLDEEQTLIEQCRINSSAFVRIFDEYYGPIFGYVLRRVARYDIAKDIVSETFLKAFSAIPRYQWNGISISSWLYRIATNEVNQYFRKKHYSPSLLNDILSPDFEIPDLEEERFVIDRKLEQHEEFLRVQKILTTLPVHYQEVIALRFFEEKSLKDISDILGKAEGTVKSLLSRGLEKIRERLK